MKELIQGVKMQRNNTPNKETLETFDEVEEMQKHPENYKKYSSVDEMFDEIEKEWDEIFAEDILKYGEIIFDEEKEIDNAFIRIRKINCSDKCYVHIMVNGKCIYCERTFR